MKISDIPTPFYIVYEDRLRKNLDLITDVARRADVKIIMAFKANALWKTFDIFKEYDVACTASSLNELRLGREYLTDRIYSYSPAYTDATIDEYLAGSTHITFNTLGQWERFRDRVNKYNATSGRHVSPGLRVNPRCSVIATDLYNPALPGSRFGVSAADVADGLPDGIEGLHFHALCESTSHDLAKVLASFEAQFGRHLEKIKWVNMGGGHIMTRAGYDTDHLVEVLRDFKSRYPWVDIILEPGSAFTWRTGDLISSVVDIVSNDGVTTAIMDVSFACHMPDTLEMPYKPAITESDGENPVPGHHVYRLGGNSCLSGDFMGDWSFTKPLKEGDRLTLEDMNHYTTVKTNMFNGIDHPAIVFCDKDGECRYVRQFTYDDYKSRMS